MNKKVIKYRYKYCRHYYNCLGGDYMEVLARLTGLPIAYRDSPLACSINCMYFHLHDYMSQLGQPAFPRWKTPCNCVMPANPAENLIRSYARLFILKWIKESQLGTIDICCGWSKCFQTAPKEQMFGIYFKSYMHCKIVYYAISKFSNNMNYRS